MLTESWLYRGHFMTFNLAAGSKEERERINVDLAAAGVAYKERLNMPALPGDRKSVV